MPSLITDPSQLAVPAGFTQVPLTSPDQLTVGAYITGPAWSFVREVKELMNSNTVMTAPVPAFVVQEANHIHTVRQGAPCTCGLRIDTIRESLLPRADGMFRTYILVPQRPLSQADRFTVYQAPDGRALRVSRGQWLTSAEVGGARNLPIFPVLHPIWTVPPALRRWLPE